MIGGFGLRLRAAAGRAIGPPGRGVRSGVGARRDRRPRRARSHRLPCMRRPPTILALTVAVLLAGAAQAHATTTVSTASAPDGGRRVTVTGDGGANQISFLSLFNDTGAVDLVIRDGAASETNPVAVAAGAVGCVKT